MNIKLRFIAIASLTSVAFVAHASAPWYVDWCYTAPFKRFVLRLSYLDNDQITSRTQSLLRTQISYGLTPSVEVYLKGDELQNQYPVKVGFSDATFGIKTRFWQDKKGNQFGARYEQNIPMANDGLGTAKWGDGVCLLDTYVISSKLKLYSTLGETLPSTEKQQDNTFYGVLLGFNVSKQWMLGTELYGNSPAKPGINQERAFSLGAMYQANDDLRFYARLSHSMEGFSRLALHVGVQITFGKA